MATIRLWQVGAGQVPGPGPPGPHWRAEHQVHSIGRQDRRRGQGRRPVPPVRLGHRTALGPRHPVEQGRRQHRGEHPAAMRPLQPAQRRRRHPGRHLASQGGPSGTHADGPRPRDHPLRYRLQAAAPPSLVRTPASSSSPRIVTSPGKDSQGHRAGQPRKCPHPRRSGTRRKPAARLERNRW